MAIPIPRPGLRGPRTAHPRAGVTGPGKLFFVSFTDFEKFNFLKKCSDSKLYRFKNC
jgi:hypothetical protein